MKVKERMRKAVSANENTNVFQAARIMKETCAPGLCAVTQEGRLSGILTKETLDSFVRAHDFRGDSALQFHYLSNTALKDLMTRETRSVQEEDSLSEAVRLIVETGNEFLPVLDEDGRLSGMIGANDILLAVTQGEEDL